MTFIVLWEIDSLKKALVYTAVAVVLGLVLTLVLFAMIAKIKSQDHYEIPYMRSEQLEEFRDPSADTVEYSVSDLEILAFNIVIAFVAYMLFKRKTSDRDYLHRPFPY